MLPANPLHGTALRERSVEGLPESSRCQSLASKFYQFSPSSLLALWSRHKSRRPTTLRARFEFKAALWALQHVALITAQKKFRNRYALGTSWRRSRYNAGRVSPDRLLPADQAARSAGNSVSLFVCFVARHYRHFGPRRERVGNKHGPQFGGLDSGLRITWFCSVDPTLEESKGPL